MLWWVLGAIALLPLFNFLLGVHPPTFKTDDDPGRYGLPYEAVSFPTEDGLTLRGWFIPAAVSAGDSVSEPDRWPTERHPAIIVGHGYPFDKANILGHTLFLHERYHLLLIDFRYFGESGGAYTTAGLLETRDVAAAVRYLQRRDEVETACLGAMGFSMSAAAFLMAGHPEIKAIVADSAYATLEDLIAQQFFFLPGPTKWPLVELTKLYATLLLGVNVGAAEPAEAVRSLNVPLLLIHGEGDSQIPVDHMRRIAANANPSLTEVWVVPGADHGQAHALTGRHYEARVRQFFDRSLCGRPAPISGHRTFFRAPRTNDQPGEHHAVLRRAGFAAVVSHGSRRDTSSVMFSWGLVTRKGASTGEPLAAGELTSVGPPPTIGLQEKIAKRAYEQRCREIDGHALNDWLQAERELLAS